MITVIISLEFSAKRLTTSARGLPKSFEVFLSSSRRAGLSVQPAVFQVELRQLPMILTT